MPFGIATRYENCKACKRLLVPIVVKESKCPYCGHLPYYSDKRKVIMVDLKIVCQREDDIGGHEWYCDLTDGNHSVQLASGRTAGEAKRKANAVLAILIRNN